MKVTAPKRVAHIFSSGTFLAKAEKVHGSTLSPFLFERQYQTAVIAYVSDVLAGIMDGVARKFGVDPDKISKSFHVSANDLLKAMNTPPHKLSPMMKGLFDDVIEKPGELYKYYKQFGVMGKGKIKPMKIGGKVVTNFKTGKPMTEKEWKKIENAIVKYYGDNVGGLDDEMALRTMLLGMLRYSYGEEDELSDEELLDLEMAEVQKDHYYPAGFPRSMGEAKAKHEFNGPMLQSIAHAKQRAGQYLSIDDGEIRNKVIKAVRNVVTGSLEDGDSETKMVSRLYHMDPEDVLGKKYSKDNLEYLRRDWRRVAATETSDAINNGFLQAVMKGTAKGEDAYVIFQGPYYAPEKSGGCNQFIGEIFKLTNSPTTAQRKNDTSGITNDPYAIGMVWPGKNNIGRSMAQWRACIPMHPWCRHWWEVIYPAEEHYSHESGKIVPGMSKSLMLKSNEYDAKELSMGRKIEEEHGVKGKAAEKIAKDHLDEIPDYYTRLKKMEAEAKKELGLEKAKREQPAGYEKETERINSHKVKWASKRHKFKAAKWTHKNGHPRCIRCGEEERTGGVCVPEDNPALEKAKKSWVKQTHKRKGHFRETKGAKDAPKKSERKRWYTPDPSKQDVPKSWEKSPISDVDMVADMIERGLTLDNIKSVMSLTDIKPEVVELAKVRLNHKAFLVEQGGKALDSYIRTSRGKGAKANPAVRLEWGEAWAGRAMKRGWVKVLPFDMTSWMTGTFVEDKKKWEQGVTFTGKPPTKKKLKKSEGTEMPPQYYAARKVDGVYLLKARGPVKYYKRVYVGRKSQKYRYFYTKTDYAKYLKEKKDAKAKKSAVTIRTKRRGVHPRTEVSESRGAREGSRKLAKVSSGIQSRASEAVQGYPQYLPKITVKLPPKIKKLKNGWTLRPHQTEGAERIIQGLNKHDGFLLMDEPGLGKTNTALAALVATKPKRTLIVTYTGGKKSQRKNWEESAENFGVDIRTDLKSAHDSQESGVWICAYDDLMRNKGFKDTDFDLVMFDECQSLKNGGSKSGYSGKVLQDHAKKVVYMSATPFTNVKDMHYLTRLGLFEYQPQKDLYEKIEKLDEATKGMKAAQKGKLMTSILDQDTPGFRGFLEDNGATFNEYGYWENPEDPTKMIDINARIMAKGHGLQRRANIAGMKSDFSVVPLTVQQKKWLQAGNDMFAEFKDNAISRGQGGRFIANYIKAMQSSWNLHYLEWCKIPAAVAAAKAALKRGEQPAVFSYFVSGGHAHIDGAIKMLFENPKSKYFSPPAAAHAREKMQAMLPNIPSITETLVKELGGPKKVAQVHGGVSDAGDTKSSKEQARYNSGEKKILVASVAKGGTGLSFHDTKGNAPRTQINMTLPWSADKTVQLMGRLHRLGSKSKTNMVFLMARTPSEERLATVVASRMESMGSLVSGNPHKKDLTEHLTAFLGAGAPSLAGTALERAYAASAKKWMTKEYKAPKSISDVQLAGGNVTGTGKGKGAKRAATGTSLSQSTQLAVDKAQKGIPKTATKDDMWASRNMAFRVGLNRSASAADKEKFIAIAKMYETEFVKRGGDIAGARAAAKLRRAQRGQYATKRKWK